MSNIENESRAQFEVYASEHYLLCERSDARNEQQNDEYIDSDMQVAWEAWGASRQVLTVILPKPITDLRAHGEYRRGHGSMYDSAKAAIESQGVKCK